MIALLPLLRHRATWGVGIALGVLVAIAAHGKLRYAEGHRTGSAEADAKHATADAIARQAFDSAWAVLYAQAAAARDAQRDAERAAARAESRSRIATARLTDALTAYRADTVAQSPVCDEMAAACAYATALWAQERDTLAHLIAVQDTTILRQTEMIATEPARLAAALRSELARQRTTFRGPSRVRWLSVGAAMGLLAGVLR